MDIESLHRTFLKCTGVSTDTRTVKEGQLFFALKGENFDGNKFIDQALAAGAICAVSDDQEASKGENIIYVDSVIRTLQSLANYHRNTLDISIIAITGTNGKTTTKELLFETLSRKYKVQKTIGNLNNHIGVPLTLLNIKEETEFAIIEMGANKKNDIKELCDIAEPDFGLITNIGSAHLQGFENLEGVASAKGELYQYLFKEKKIAFINAKDSLLTTLAPPGLEILLYNLTEYKAANDSNGLLQVGKKVDDKLKWIPTKLFGKFNLQNIVVAIEVAQYFDVSFKNIQEAISSYVPSLMRSQISVINDSIFYIDAYNANPSSMSLGIANFLELQGEKTLILGDMKELGPGEVNYHREILEKIPNDIGKDLILIGEIFYGIEDCKASYSYKSVEKFISNFDFAKIRQRKVFLKGSRSIGLERIVTAFEKL